jgi:hypothetical protein
MRETTQKAKKTLIRLGRDFGAEISALVQTDNAI